MKKRKNPPHFYEKKGKTWTAYYHAVRVGKKLVWTPLGPDRNAALRKWAELEHRDVPVEAKTVLSVTAQYMEWAEKEVAAHRLSPRTFADRDDYLRQILPVFGKHPIESIRPEHIQKYLDKRTAKIVGKKEMRFFSVLWNWARVRGITALANPVSGVKMPTEVGRTIVVRDVDYWLVYECGDQLVRDVLLLAARLGTRPQEVFGLLWSKVTFSGDTVAVDIWQRKVGQWRTVLGDRDLADQLRAMHDSYQGQPTYVLSDPKGGPRKLTGSFRYSFDKARKKAAEEAKARGIEYIDFQLRDVRPMAGIKQLIESGMDAARQLLGHSTEAMTAHYTTKRIGMVSKSGTMKQISNKKDDSGE